MSGSEVFLERSSSTKKVLSRKPSFVISNKVKTFKNDFVDALQNTGRHSNIYDLASEIYTRNVGNRFAVSSKKEPRSPDLNQEQKEVKTVVSGNKILRMSLVRSEKGLKNTSGLVETATSRDVLMGNLTKRTGMLGEYKERIDELNTQKLRLSEKIEETKRKIQHEKKLRYKLEIEADKHMNSTESAFDFKTKIQRETTRNKDSQDQSHSLCRNLGREVASMDQANLETLQQIKEQQRTVKALEEEYSNLKHAVFLQSEKLNEVKSNLTVSLKTMRNESEMIKYLESQKADLLLWINKETEENRVGKL